DLYQQFGDWPLALAAYNGGEKRVAWAVRQTGTRNFWELAAKNLLPKETQRYVPAVLAVIYLLSSRKPTETPPGENNLTTKDLQVARPQPKQRSSTTTCTATITATSTVKKNLRIVPDHRKSEKTVTGGR
ncbi:MAG TPA: transglycosylase SLT domain-containing protein, partial [Acidobacteriota bacterium]